MTDVVFLLDVDNTLLDNDVFVDDLRRHLRDAFGDEGERRYWDIFEDLRQELGYVDYLGALQRYRLERSGDPYVHALSLFLLHYPFADRLYPRAFDVIAHLTSRGPVVILTDGDGVLQPWKVQRSGLWAAVGGRVLIYIHEEAMLADVERRYPARRYVIVDDKIRLLSPIKKIWGDRVTTVFVRQGHYAHDTADVASYPAADVTIDRIADLIDLPLGR